MELRHLRCVVAVADTLHFGRAAGLLGMAQPPLSQQVKTLENELGVRLFERTSRQVSLTPAGEAFVAEARGVLAAADRARLAAEAAGRGDVGRLSIGLVGSATLAALPPVVRAFRSRYPDVELTLRELPTSSQVTAILTGELDAGFLRPPLAGDAERRLTLLALGDESLVAALPSGHRLAGRSRLSANALSTERFVLFPRPAGPGLYDQIMALCRTFGFEPFVAQEAGQMQTIVGLVASGLGVALVPSSVARSTRPDVSFVALTPRPIIPAVSLAWRQDDPGQVVANLVRIARDVAGAGRRERRSRHER